MPRVRCSTCGSYIDRGDVYLSRSIQRYCSPDCVTQARTNQRARRRASPNLSLELRRQIHARDHDLCRHCGKRGDHVHHIVFRSQGGTDDPSNLILLCRRDHMHLAHGPEAGTYRRLFQAYIAVLAEGRQLFVPELASRLEQP